MPKVLRKQATEAEIEHQILVSLNRLKGGFFWKNTSGGFYDGRGFRPHSSEFAISGTSDILGIYASRLVVLEVKRPGLKGTAEQLAFIGKIRSLGGEGTVVHSLAEVREFFLERFDVYVE